MKVDEQRCIGCGKCVKDCFSRIIHLGPGHAVIEDAPCMECFHCIAICPPGAIVGTAEEMAQVRPYDAKTFSVAPEHLTNLMQFRRSVRQFRREQLEEDMLHQLLEAARYAPTAGNRQPLRYLVLQEQLAEITKQAIFALGDAAERNDALKSIFGGHRTYADFWRRGKAEYVQNGTDRMFYGAPTVILFVGPPEAAVDAGIASSHTELLAAAMGLGVCYVHFFKRACAADPTLPQRLSIGPEETILTVLAIGHPVYRYRRTVPRKPAKIARM